MRQLKGGQFHIEGRVIDQTTKAPLDNATVCVIDRTFMDPKRDKHVHDPLGAGADDGRVSLDFSVKYCRVVGPLRQAAWALGVEEKPGRIGLDIGRQGYRNETKYFVVDELPQDEQGKKTIDLGTVELSR